MAIMDFVLGNWGLNTKFKAAPGKTTDHVCQMILTITGKANLLLTGMPPLDSIAYPFSTKPELTSQLPGLKKQILRYADYGNKTYDSLFSSEMRSNALTI